MSQAKTAQKLIQRAFEVSLYLSKEDLRRYYNERERDAAVSMVQEVIDLASQARDGYGSEGFENLYLLGVIAASLKTHIKEVWEAEERKNSTNRSLGWEFGKYRGDEEHVLTPWFRVSIYGRADEAPLDEEILDEMIEKCVSLGGEYYNPELDAREIVSLSEKLRERQAGMERAVASMEKLQESLTEIITRDAATRGACYSTLQYHRCLA